LDNCIKWANKFHYTKHFFSIPSAKGLFQKAVKSGSFRSEMLEKATTQAITTEVIKALILQPNQVDSL
jgi:para-nitrobenzyl esterase